MTVMFRITRSVVVLVAAATILSSSLVAQQSDENALTNPRPVDRVALLSGVSSTLSADPVAKNEPVPFSVSSMASDAVPPFAAHPELQPISETSSEDEISFEENIPVTPKSVESIDDCCRELTEMIAGNLDSEISLDARKRMIETALKMVARNVALKAEAKITKLKADHALEMARMHGQMGQMRSMSNAADQINRVAGPLSQMLEKNYQQAVAMYHGNQQLSHTLAHLGFDRLEQDAKTARANRQRIQLKTPSREEAASRLRIEELDQQIAQLQRQRDAEYVQPVNSNVARASFIQPLQPRRQPLGPQRVANEYFDGRQKQPSSQWRR